MKRIVILTSVTLSAVVFWAFVGAERVVGDHEEGVSWPLFVKHEPTFQFHFHNPAQRVLDIDPFDELSPTEQANFHEFCKIRYGKVSIRQCYTQTCGRRLDEDIPPSGNGSWKPQGACWEYSSAPWGNLPWPASSPSN
ncbi:hypothetical protein [Rhodanobacter sp. MP7CTX1]|uniref:hypothetical protein n=1 Tax=Rhodanobacter sp. MP7CTX1 TaxID=2723084 RepID=UPI001622D03F|nr:hypothetical protein [Rhodanobacter sp. MP7CTX1]MBB6186430.1 hypothetical protein [Rhodanobacter sp. MP7CTX1]